MAGIGKSKNNPDSKGKSQQSILVTSTICENCKEQCKRGVLYLQNFYKHHSGKGCVCEKLKSK
jgi:hypothetical protein